MLLPAVALADSPAGLLALQLDKYQLWQPGWDEHFGLGEDFIFANATLYWMTRSAGSSMRVYSASRDPEAMPASAVPAGVSVFGSGDFTSAQVAARENNLIAWYAHSTRGHVAALDAPVEFVADPTDFIDRTGEPMTNTHTIVLLGGSGLGPWAWGGVTPILNARGLVRSPRNGQ